MTEAASHSLTHSLTDSPSFLRRYLFSTDHKTIGIQFLFTSLFMILFGGLLAMLIRW